MPAPDTDLRLRRLRCEYLDNPLGIDTPWPRFSWVLESDRRGVSQFAYRILVGRDAAALAGGEADAWDSGRVESARSVNVPYDGENIESDTTYFWKVKAWDQDGQEGAWSRVARFHTGLLFQQGWEGDWIAAPDPEISAPLMRRSFFLDKPGASGHVHVCGLGYYELYVNGEKVGRNVLDPGTTEYDKRALYATYDVSPYLQEGMNAVGLILGRGWYVGSEAREDTCTKRYGDRPCVVLQMNMQRETKTDYQLYSDDNWKVASGPILENDVWNGEVYDARRERPGWSEAGYDDSEWDAAVVVDGPGGGLHAQLMPPIRVTRTLRPVRMTEPEERVYVFDFGQVMTGWPRLHVQGPAGTEVTMRTAEVTRAEMARMQGKEPEEPAELIDPRPNRSAKARDVYTLKGGGQTEVYEPRFTYHGFRYVQVEGFPGDPSMLSVEAQVVHTAVERTGQFCCSNKLLRKVHENTIWGQVSNLHSMPTDCPQRDERQGWMGDGHLTVEEAAYNFDMAAFYTKWLADMEVAQAEDGSVPDCVPYHDFGGEVGTPAWQVAYPLTVWYMHKHYGDSRVLVAHYDSLVRWMDYMADLADDHIVEAGRGDWVPPQRTQPENQEEVYLTSTAYYYRSAQILADAARMIGRTEDAERYDALATEIRDAFNERFFDTGAGRYEPHSQCSQAFPLYFGLVPDGQEEAVLEALVDDIMRKREGHLWTGILGTKALVKVLPRMGRSDVMYTVATRETFPGWGYMLSQGATTLWERWGGYRYFDAGMNSLNHIMFGSVEEFFYRDLAGIAPAGPGYEKVRIRPRVVGDLTDAGATVQTVRGEVRSGWQVVGGALHMEATIPANTTAEIWVPKRGREHVTINVNGRTVWADGNYQEGAEGILSAAEEGDCVKLEAGSGTYCLVVE